MLHRVRLLVVDDHFVVRKGVCALLAGVEAIAVVGEAADGLEAVSEARRLRPEVILMDLRLPGLDGAGATRQILAEQPEVGIVVLTSAEAEDDVLTAVRAGATGYLAKSSPREEFITAVTRAARGEMSLPSRLSRRLFGRPAAAQEAAESLTSREREVLGRVARGWSNRRIAEELRVAEITVRSHVSHILDKLGVANRVEASLYALRCGLVKLEDA
ncbi:MAG: response regulator transcription factor [Thermoanaerobaculia bacterium]|nr:response regulator transcription factor [Thermoanaerobaculia bacterium]